MPAMAERSVAPSFVQVTGWRTESFLIVVLALNGAIGWLVAASRTAITRDAVAYPVLLLFEDCVELVIRNPVGHICCVVSCRDEFLRCVTCGLCCWK